MFPLRGGVGVLPPGDGPERGEILTLLGCRGPWQIHGVHPWHREYSAGCRRGTDRDGQGNPARLSRPMPRQVLMRVLQAFGRMDEQNAISGIILLRDDCCRPERYE
jgi:hypothetical protein